MGYFSPLKAGPPASPNTNTGGEHTHAAQTSNAKHTGNTKERRNEKHIVGY